MPTMRVVRASRIPVRLVLLACLFVGNLPTLHSIEVDEQLVSRMTYAELFHEISSTGSVFSRPNHLVAAAVFRAVRFTQLERDALMLIMLRRDPGDRVLARFLVERHEHVEDETVLELAVRAEPESVSTPLLFDMMNRSFLRYEGPEGTPGLLVALAELTERVALSGAVAPEWRVHLLALLGEVIRVARERTLAEAATRAGRLLANQIQNEN